MRIAILLLNSGRGSGEVARSHALHLTRLGHEVIYVQPRAAGSVEGVTVLDLPLPCEILPVHENLPSAGARQKAVSVMSYEEAMAYLPAYERALELVADKVDLVIGHHANLSAVATAEVCRRHGLPYVLFLHGTGIEPRHHGGYDDRLWARIEQSIRDAAGVLVTTDYVRDQLVRPLCDLPLERFEQAAVEQVMAEYGLERPYVICPGALTAVKGPQNVVEASREYADLAPTVFIGDGELRGELEQRAGDRARFLGFVPTEHKEALIAGAEVLLAAPQKNEHFGIIYVEALAAGTVPVLFEGVVVGSIVTPETGCIVRRDPGALGRATRELLLDPEGRRRMAERGRVRARQLFDYPQIAQRLERWLVSVVEQAEPVAAD